MEVAVFFNIDGTLTEMKGDYEKIYKESIEAADLQDMESSYKDYKDDFFNFFKNGWSFPRRQAMDKICREKGCDPAKVEKFAEKWENLESDSVKTKNGVKEALEELSKDYELGIISNGTTRLQRLKLKRNGILNMFKSVIISADFGAGKPSEDIFEKAKSDIKAEKYVLVSDVLERDVLASKKYGFEPVWLYEGDKNFEEKLRGEIHIIKEFRGIKDILNEMKSD